MSKTPNVTFVDISKCNIKLPSTFGNSKKGFCEPVYCPPSIYTTLFFCKILTHAKKIVFQNWLLQLLVKKCRHLNIHRDDIVISKAFFGLALQLGVRTIFESLLTLSSNLWHPFAVATAIRDVPILICLPPFCTHSPTQHQISTSRLNCVKINHWKPIKAPLEVELYVNCQPYFLHHFQILWAREGCKYNQNEVKVKTGNEQDFPCMIYYISNTDQESNKWRNH